MMTRKKRRMIIIGIPLLVVVIFITILIVLYLNTDMFKSNKTLFFKYFSQNYDNINQITEDLKNDEYNNVFQSNKFRQISELKINYTENYGTTLENTDNAINKLKITIDGETNKENGYQYKDIKLLNNEEKNAEIEYMKNDNIYGLRFSDLFNQYITVENDNIKELFKKIGYSEESLQNMPESIELKDIQNIKFSKEELETLKDKYLNLINTKISKDKFAKKSNQKIVINDKNILANAYIINLTKEEFNNIYLEVLESLKNDEIILGKIEQIQNYFNIFDFNNINYDLKEQYVNYLEKIIESVNKTNIGNEEITISVYENNGDTIRTSIQSLDFQMNFDNLKTNEEIFSNIIFKEKEKEIKNITLIKKQNNLEISIKNNIESDSKMIVIKKIQNINENKYNKDINIKYEDGNNRIDANYTETINELKELQTPKEFNGENSIKLNELDNEQISNLLIIVKEELAKKIDKIMQDIRGEDIKKILKNIGVINSEINIEVDGVSEAEKNRFNSKFDFLQGENLNINDVLNTINVIKENVINLQVVSNSELKIEISKNNSNEQLVKTLEDFINKYKDRTYNVKLEYDEETGLVKYVILNMLEKSR